MPRHGLGSSSGNRLHIEEKATWLSLMEVSQLRDSAGFKPDFAIHRCPGDIVTRSARAVYRTLGHREPQLAKVRILLRIPR